jgi:hypothetical protein
MHKLPVALAMLALAATAHAAKFNVWAGHDGITNISAVITTRDTLNTVGGYDILSIEGTSTWGTITGLITNPSQPYTSFYWPDGHVTASYQSGAEWPFDNVLYDNGGAWFSENGVLFQTATAIWNLAIYQGQDYVGLSSLGSFDATEWRIPIEVTRISDQAVPEPASWAMMIAGFGMIGGLLRSRRRGLPSFG